MIAQRKAANSILYSTTKNVSDALPQYKSGGNIVDWSSKVERIPRWESSFRDYLVVAMH